MKKILAFTCATMLIMPVIAEEMTPVAPEPTSAVSEVSESASNSKIKFPRGMQAGIGVSATSGLNMFVGYANKNFESFWWKRLGARLDFGTISPMRSSINSTLNSALGGDNGLELGDGLYLGNADFNASHFGLLVDFYPFGNTWFAGGIRLTTGYVTGKIGLNANLTGKVDGMPDNGMEFELNDTMYRYNGGDINGRGGVNWKYSGPYLGTGFDLGLFMGIKIYMDLGVVFTSKTAKLGLDVPVSDKLQISTDDGLTWKSVKGTVWQAQFDHDKKMALKDANDDLSKLKFFPLLKLGLMYRF